MSAVEAPASSRPIPPALERVISAVRAGNIPDARRLAHLALAEGIEHPLLLNLRARDFEDAGEFEKALKDLRRAHVLAPADFAILNACGLCLGQLERLEEALQCFEQVNTMKPDFGPGWFNRAWALERLGEKVKAAQSYSKAVELNPENAQAWANLAFLAARRADMSAASIYAQKALDAQPGHPTARLVLAQTEMATTQAAEHRLRGMLDEDLSAFDRGLALSMLADALDAQDRVGEAFAAYSEGNAVFRMDSKARFEGHGQPTMRDSVTSLVDWAEHLDPTRWRANTAPVRSSAGETEHVFLLGFPRSGTTLIESALSAHPKVVSLEERNTLYAGVLDFLTDSGSLAQLESASEWSLRSYREDYWARVKKFGVQPEGKVFIDKNPLNTAKLPLIYKLFPYAKIIFAVRDPRDVILSCFRMPFSLNPSTYEFLDLQRAASVYSKTMQLADVLREKQPQIEYKLFYERLVEDFEAVAQAVCAFIGAEWREDLINFSSRARRGEVASASSAQIARGLFSDGVGKWRRYRRELEPVMDVLAPWIERFGYPID